MISAVMIAVDEVHVGVAGRTEQDGIARSLAAKSVGAGIERAEVGFGFDDASGEQGLVPKVAAGFPTFARRWRMWATISRSGRGRQAADEELAEEFAGDGARVARVEGARQRRELGKDASGGRSRGHGAGCWSLRALKVKSKDTDCLEMMLRTFAAQKRRGEGAASGRGLRPGTGYLPASLAKAAGNWVARVPYMLPSQAFISDHLRPLVNPPSTTMACPVT